MFVRVKSRPNTKKKAVQIVKAVRDGQKVQQKVIQTVGYAFDTDTLERLKDVAEHLKAKLAVADKPSLFSTKQLANMAIEARKRKEGMKNEEKLMVDLKKLRETNRFTVGIHDIYGKVYKLLRFDEVLTKRYASAKGALYHTTMARLANPVSKRASVAMLDQDFGVNLSTDKVYRMMNKIDERVIEKIQKKAFEVTKSLLKDKIKVIFYDCTTLYFESFKPDELKQNGYSKDGKFNQPQVLLALLVTDEGLPIGYEVFPGSTFEGHTLAPVLEKIKSRYSLDRVVFVADSGLLSEANRMYLDKIGVDYILGARLKNLPKSLQRMVVDPSSYSEEINQNREYKIAEFEYKKCRLITSYNKSRAKKDEHDRVSNTQKLGERLAKSRNPKSLLANYGYKKYLSVSGNTKLDIDKEKITADADWDGLHGVITNIKDLPKKDILRRYRELWQIESCFRIQKHNLKIRPIFHWTPKRIRAHIAICFIAFTCHQYLSYRLKLQSIQLSIEEVRNALVHIQLSVLKDTMRNCSYGVPSKMNEKAKKIYKVLQLKYDVTPFLITED